MNYFRVENNIKKLIFREDVCYVNLMQLFEQLACDYVYAMQYYSDILELDENFNNYVSYLGILKQSLKFMKNVNSDYYILLKKAYKAKEINIDFKKGAEAYCDYRKGKKFINWPINYNIDDAFSLNHEFSHYLNMKKNVSLSRNYFTEAFSDLFEFLFYDYLETNNYSNKDYLKVKLLRFASCFDYAKELYNYGRLVNIFLENSKLDGTLIEKNYNQEIPLEQIKNQCCIYKSGLPFFEYKKYLLGIFMACDIHQQILQNPSYIQNIFYLMDNVNQMSLNDCFKELNIKILNDNHNLTFDNTSYDRIMTNFSIELKDSYNKFRGVINEKSYRNCRTYSCRKNEIKY